MKLLTVGDSFTWGEELEDRNLAWPYRLGEKLGYEVTNLAKPGSGNSRMIRTVVQQADQYDLVIVAWSHFARTELADAHGAYDLWPGSRADIYPDHMSHRQEVIEYYNRYHNDQYLYTQYLLGIILLQNFFKSMGVRYLMIDSFGNNQHRHLDVPLTAKISAEFYPGWSNETMMEWTYGSAQGPGGHFLAEGHQQVAEKLYEHIRHLSWIS